MDKINRRKEKMDKKLKRNVILISFIFLVILSSLAVSAYTRATGQFSQFTPFTTTGFEGFDRSMCEAGQDFILQIDPAGCTPSVVRSDLLEEQNVPVLCKVSAIKLNPLIDVEAIDYVNFAGSERPQEVLSIGYFPARAALGRLGARVNTFYDNIGYVQITLKRQPNETAMPDFIEGNVKANIRYDVEDAFGVGQSMYYLPVMSDSEWDNNYRQYSFWQGKGYLRAESVSSDARGSATISVYSGRGFGPVGGEKQKIASENLDIQTNRESRQIYMPGFDYCLGGMTLKLQGVESENTRAKISVDGNPLELKDNEKFLNGACSVRSLERSGLLQETEILCREDTGSETYRLSINPEIELDINGTNKSYSIGDRLYGSANGEKSIYLAYVKSKNKFSTQKEDLEIVLAAIPGTAPQLTLEQLSNLRRQINNLNPDEISNIGGLVIDVGRFYVGFGELSLRALIQGQSIQAISYGNSKQFLGKAVTIKGYSGTVNKEFSSLSDDEEEVSELQELYENAVDDYNRIVSDFSQERYPQGFESEPTLGEQALRNTIQLAADLRQNADLLDLCIDFDEFYADESSGIAKPEVCDEAYEISNNDIASTDISINGRSYRIDFKGIKEPSFEEHGATIIVRDENGALINTLELRKNQLEYLDTEANEYIRLVEADEDSVRIDVNLNITSTFERVKQFTLESGEKNLREGFPDRFGSKYLFTLAGTNVKKVAKVSVEPKINHAETEAEFPFKIGIEKRQFKFSPELTREQIEATGKLRNLVDSIQSTTDTAVRYGKIACGVTGAALTIKNFALNLRGEGIAREKVMRNNGGWFDICEDAVNHGTQVDGEGPFESVDQCLLENNDRIEAQVGNISEEIRNINNQLEDIEESIIQRGGLLDEDFVDPNEKFDRFIESNRGEIRESLGSGFSGEILIDGESVPVSEIVNEISRNNSQLSEARDLLLNSRLLDSEDETLREIAQAEINATLKNIWKNSENERYVADLSDRLAENGFAGARISGVFAGENQIEDYYDGYITSRAIGDVPEGASVAFPVYKNVNYIVQLERAGRNYQIVEIYHTNGAKVNPNVTEYQEIKSSFIYRHFDGSTYENSFEGTERVRYYETGSYKGVPAIVPFDLENGWYAAVKPTLSLTGGIRAVDESGRVSSFWLCNIGQDGREEFSSLTSDDICRQFIPGIGQSPDFPGLSQSESARLMNLAGGNNGAIEQALRQYGTGVGSVRLILAGRTIDVPVGEPYIETPGMQCQDFMSPSDCNILFNVCDPVVCPSSRCDFGGKYPVADVVQSGVVGSALLCAPNWPEIKVPVCLSGINAGLQGLSSVMESYQQCLNASLESGQTVGICDQIQSVYFCDLAWREGAFAAKTLGASAAGKIFGSSSAFGSGGGEYSSFQNALSNADDSVEFFTDHYAVNSFEAFKARNIQNAGTAICRNAIFGSYPADASVFDALITPDSPPQYLGNFEEIPYTTATNPPTSQYKVFYHIFAGRDRPAFFEVYLKGTGTSFFQDTGFKRIVSRGYIAAGEFATNTTDFLAPSGYKEMCIIVNGQEECGFQEVTTDFGLNRIRDEYLQEQIAQGDITSENECISGTPGTGSFLAGASSGNLQQAVTETADPAIYDRGIIRICSTENPGSGSDPLIGTTEERYKKVGYCGNQNVGCWLDSDSITESIRSLDIQEDLLEDFEEKSLAALRNETPGAITNFDGFVEEVEGLEDEEKVRKISDNIPKVFLSYEKAYLYLLRGDAYQSLAKELYDMIRVSVTIGEISPSIECVSNSDCFPGEVCASGVCRLAPTTDTGESGVTDLGDAAVVLSEIEAGEYPIFEFQDGLTNANLYYVFYKGRWAWTKYPNMLELRSVEGNIDEDIVESDTDAAFIESLRGKNYIQGLQSLIERTRENNEGGFFAKSWRTVTPFSNAKLSTDNAEMDNEGRFEFEIRGIYYWFEYDVGTAKWMWSFNERHWQDVPETVIEGSGLSSFEGTEPISEVVSLINSLERENFLGGARILFGIKPDSLISGATQRSSCTTQEECQEVLGAKIIKIADELKDQAGESASDATVFSDTGARSFECLVLQVAYLESSIQQCGSRVGQGFQENGDPLYCSNDFGKTLSGDEGKSVGVMQINTDKHTGVNVVNFEKNVGYGADLLIENYDTGEKPYRCYRPSALKGSPVRETDFQTVSYSGWKRALREYNGWNDGSCVKDSNNDEVLEEVGNPRYVDDVLSFGDEIQELFPEECGLVSNQGPGQAAEGGVN